MQTRPANSPLAAIGFVIAASALVTLSTFQAKMLGRGYGGEALHPLQISAARYVAAFLAVGVVVALRRPAFGPIHWRLHVLRSSCGWAGVSLMFASVAMIPMADATAISFLNPVFAMVFAVFLLGERVGVRRWSAAAAALLGGIILLRPGGGVELGAALALGAAILIGFEVIVVKRLTGLERPLQLLFVNNGVGAVIALVALPFVFRMPSADAALVLAGVGVAMVIGQALFLQAFTRAEASLVMPFWYATLIFAALADWAGYGAVPDGTALVGMGVIIAAGAFLAWREAVAAKHR